jgi:MFS family permease
MTHPSKRGAMAALAICMLLPSLGTSIANVALPTLATSFAVSAQQVRWVVLSYLLSMTASIVFAGRLADVYGARRTLLAGLMLFGLASLACGAAPSLLLLTIARALQGAGAAVMMAVTLALVRSVVPASDTSRAMGMLGSVSAVGTALGPSLGGLLIATFGWRSVFLVKAPLVVIAVFVVLRFVASDRAAVANTRTSSGIRGVGALLHDPVLVNGFLLSAMVSTVLMATLVVGPFYLTRALGLSTAAIGLVMSVGPAAAALSAAPSGRVVATYGTSRVLVAALVGLLIGALLFALLPRGSGVSGYVASLVILTTAYAAFQTANNTSVMLAAGDTQRGVVSGMLNMSRNLGLIIGASLMGSLYDIGAHISHASAAGRAEAGFRVTFAVAAAILVVAIATARREPHAPEHARAPLPRPT